MQMNRHVAAWIAGIAAMIGLALAVEIAVKPDNHLTMIVTPAEDSADSAANADAPQTTVNTPTEEIIQNSIETPDRNLNTADAAALKRVSGVGDVLAEAIIAYRAEIGGFTRRQQLLEIDGIGETLAARIMAEFEIPGELPPETTAAGSVQQTTLTAPVATVPEWTAGMHYELNHVTRDELCSIPGMTETWADEILYARERIGRFETVYELAAVLPISGRYIQSVLFEYLYVDGDTVLGSVPVSENYDMRDAAAG